MSAEGEMLASNGVRADGKLTSRLGASDEEVNHKTGEDERVGDEVEPVRPVAEQAQAEAESVKIGGDDAESRTGQL